MEYFGKLGEDRLRSIQRQKCAESGENYRYN